jgi:hypothetical protein
MVSLWYLKHAYNVEIMTSFWDGMNTGDSISVESFWFRDKKGDKIYYSF